VLLATYKHLWAVGKRDRALSELSSLISTLPKFFPDLKDESRELKVACLLKRAQWVRILHEDNLTESVLNEVTASVKEARDLATDQYSVWHAWAVTNYYQLRLADSKESATEDSTNISTRKEHAVSADDNFNVDFYDFFNLKKWKAKRRNVSFANLVAVAEVDLVTSYVIEAIRGFIRSIVLGKDQPVANVLQDTLRLLTLWFSYGTRAGVFQILDSELDSISAEEWLSVTPQLIARIHMKSEISRLLRKILGKVAAAHPQALVCPISVALNTGEGQQCRLASDVLQVISQQSAQLVSEATVVSTELLRVAISPHELWHEGLERAAHVYITTQDSKSMLSILHMLHVAMGDVPKTYNITAPRKDAEAVSVVGNTTLRDVSFRYDYGRDLSAAFGWLEKYCESGSLADLHQAWEFYYSVSKRIATQLNSLKVLELSHVSPKLTDLKTLLLAVPGTYRPGKDVIRIASFATSVDVIRSKQRPRKMVILGSDGVEYRFLLKGHEDLRQDERVMQLFGLINACLENNRYTRKRGCKIVRYTVLPLSNNSGLIGWVDNCDTLNQLIRRYREERGVRVDVEQHLYRLKAQEFDKLTLIQKIEVFRQVQEETCGRELSTMLWLNSKTSDAWVERRGNFTKSLAVTSMVGYILGLGDRHPSNLMLDRVTGRVVHIDFGDCFEVAMQRSKFPETVPFRLTRMLVLCMEASGIEGTYRSTAETVSVQNTGVHDLDLLNIVFISFDVWSGYEYITR